KIVVAGSSDAAAKRGGESGENDFALARYTAEGNLDPSFGSSGKVLTDFACCPGGNSSVEAIRIQSDGKIVAAGGGFGDFALARYSDNGKLDPSFGSGGKLLTHFRSG